MSLSCKVGNGSDIDFFRGSWIGKGLICNQFPVLYQALQEPKMRFIEVGSVVHNIWYWLFYNIQEILFVPKVVECDSMQSILQHIQTVPNQYDLFLW